MEVLGWCGIGWGGVGLVDVTTVVLEMQALGDVGMAWDGVGLGWGWWM